MSATVKNNENSKTSNAQDKPENIQYLFSQLISYIENMNLKESVKINYDREIENLRKLMIERNITFYTTEFGSFYINERFKEVHSRTLHYVIRKIIYILDCNFNEDVIHKHVIKNKTVAPEFANVLNHYEKECKKKGYSDETIRKKMLYAIRFVNNIKSIGCFDIKQLSYEDVIKGCALESSKFCKCYIGDFLQFLFEYNYLHYNYKSLVPKSKRPKTIPSVYTADEVIEVEKAARNPERNNEFCSKRDLVITLLASRYGIRCGDISRLTKENVDFKKKRIMFIQHKTNVPFDCTLFQDVEDALHQYLDVRPESTYQELFLQSLAPYQPLTPGGINDVIKRAFEKSGVNTAGKHHGPHALRSTNASLKVNSGMTYAEVKKSIGWIGINIMKKYVAIDIERLRFCALDPIEPNGGSFFDNFLHGKERL